MYDHLKHGRRPIPEYDALAVALSVPGTIALSNHVQGGATITAPTLPPYNPIVSPLITRKVSGKFFIWVVHTLTAGGESALAAGDGITYRLTRVTPGAVALTPIWESACITSTGNANSPVSLLTAIFIDDASAVVAVGATASYGLTVTASNGHTSGVTATTDGNIVVVELPG
jgi:hypothetical protein